ncbi:MAG: A/G-specific adenine glycosylase [Verrucomicrobiota bacterium]
MIKPSHPAEAFWKIDLKIRRAFHESLKNWFLTHQRNLPWRDPRTPYAVTVSELMLQQTQVKTVIPYFNRWMTTFPNWKALASASEQSVLKSWEGLGYYSRARNLHRLAQTVVTELKGIMPSTVEGLTALPGIGRYTAGAIASLAFNQKAPLVDGNVIRVFARIFACAENVAKPNVIAEFWNLAEALLPETDFGIHNESLMELGALICTPKNPSCSLCPMQKICKGKTSPELYPQKDRPKAEKLQEKIALITQGKKYWVIPGKERQNGFWLFPTFNPSTMKWNQDFGSMKYGFTKYTIEMTYGLCEFKSKKSSSKEGQWMSINELESIPLPQAHRKIVKKLQKP